MKRVFTMALALVMAAGMSMPAFAADYEFSDMASGLSYKNTTGEYTFGEDIYASDKEEIKIPLTKDMFLDKDGKSISDTAAVTSSELRKSKIAVRTTIRGGSKVLKEAVSIDTKKGEIVMKFAEEWVSTKTEDFEILIYLTIDGKRMDDYGITFVGTFGNEETPVYADYDYVNLENGLVAVAEEHVPKIEVDLGNGVSIFTKLFKDKKYYGTATRDDDENALTVYSKYPDVDNVVILKAVGLNSTGDVVKLSVDYADYYVYDADMKYLGQATEMLPYSSRYYLANQKLDVEDDEEPAATDDEDEDDDADITDDEDDDTGIDDDDYTSNPDTGANGFVGLAVLAAALSLGGIVLSRKKK